MKAIKMISVCCLILIIAFRLILPYILLNYVEREINKIPEYTVKIQDLDVHLYRGSYTIKNIQLWKMNKNIPQPFFAAKAIDLSIEWKALLHGSIVAKIIAYQPIIHFLTAKNANNEQLSIDDKWVDAVKSLFPLNINKFSAQDGEIYFENFNENPPFKTYMKNVEFELENMQNVTGNKILLPSTFQFTAQPMNAGSFKAEGKFNPFNKSPTFYIKAALTSLDIRSLKNFLKYYTKVDVSSGSFSLYGEAAAAEGKIKGYAKPFIKNLKIDNPKKAGPLTTLYNGAASVVAKVLENRHKKTIATEIKLEGKIDDPNTSTLSIIGYLLKHAFIQALIPQIDHTVKLQDVVYGVKKS